VIGFSLFFITYPKDKGWTPPPIITPQIFTTVKYYGSTCLTYPLGVVL